MHAHARVSARCKNHDAMTVGLRMGGGRIAPLLFVLAAAAVPRGTAVSLKSALSGVKTHDNPSPVARTCTTCRGPVHSWAQVPVSFHSSICGTGPTGEFPDWYLETLTKFPLITCARSLQHVT
jgi:hypothetical protein